MKKMLLFGALLCGVNSLWGAVTITPNTPTDGDVTITLTEGDTTITENDFDFTEHTEEGVINRNLIIKGGGTLTTIEENAFNGLTSVGGNLIIKGAQASFTTIEENAFEGLTSIGGDLVLCDGAFGQAYTDSHNTSLATIDDNAFPDLTTVTGHILCYGCPITSLKFPQLTEVGGNLQAHSNTALETLELPVLQSVGESLSAYGNTKLTTLELPALTSVVGNLEAYNNIALETLELPVLQSVGERLWVDNNTQMTTLSLPALESVGQSLSAFNNPALTTLSLPELQSVGESLSAHNNTEMTTLELPELESVGQSLRVQGCTSLSRIPFNLFDVVQGDIFTQLFDGALSKFVSDLPEGADKGVLTGVDINPAIASAALKRNPQVTVNVPGITRSLNTHLKTHYLVSGQSDSDAQPAKHGMLGLAG